VSTAAATMPAPERRWGWADTVFLAWVWPLVLRGFSRPLDEDDIPPLPVGCQLRSTRASGAEWWARQLAAGRKPTVASMAWECHRREAILGLVISCGYGLLNVVVRPLLLKRTVELLTAETSDSSDGDHALRNGLLVASIGASMLFEGVCAASSRHFLSDRIGTAVYGQCATLVQQKSTRLAGVTSSGVQSSTLIGSDLVRAYESTKLLAFFPMCVSGGLGGCVLLLVTVGWGGAIGIAVMVAITYANMKMAGRIKAVEKVEMAAADKRLGIIRQVITDIKPIKLSSWEGSYLETIAKARLEEVKWMLKFRVLYQGSAQMGRASPFLAACPAFVYMSVSGQDMPAADIFAALSVFMGLRLALIMLPLSLSLAAATQVSLARIEDFLAMPEHESTEAAATTTTDGLLVAIGGDGGSDTGMSFKWPGAEFRLRNVSLSLRGGEIVGVTGSTGSGKTSFLCALLAEMPQCDSGDDDSSTDDSQSSRRHFVTRSVCFVSQRPFLLSASVRENITMGAVLDKARMADACERADLAQDLDELPRGLDTLVGERGVTLSGGQQMRVALARAFYQQPQVIVADDPLAAVDAAVGAHVFRSLQAYAKGDSPGGQPRAVILAMNQEHLLGGCTRLVHLEGGKQVARELPSVDSSEVKLVPGMPGKIEQESESPKPRSNAAVVQGTVDTSGDGKTPEQRQVGNVSDAVRQEYAKAVGYGWVALCVTVTLLAYVVMGFNDRWLGVYVKSDSDDDTDTFIIVYLLRSTLVYQPKDLNRDWSPRFSTLRDKNGWIRTKTTGNLNLGMSRNRFCDFLADPDSRSFSRFTLIFTGAGISSARSCSW
jgi:ABC-type multidrug transport system fused ATPase/permease subunit